MEYFGNIYPYLTEGEIKTALIRQIKHNKLEFIMPAFNVMWDSKFWRKKGFDGSTFISDKAHPSVDAFFHDYLYRVLGGGYVADYIYYKIQILLKDKSAKRNFIGTRVFGLFYRVRHFLKGRRKKIPKEFTELYLILKEKK
jgi:hypothetical protein